jgi:hypothetical protein
MNERPVFDDHWGKASEVPDLSDAIERGLVRVERPEGCYFFVKRMDDRIWPIRHENGRPSERYETVGSYEVTVFRDNGAEKAPDGE